ncbi:hypothetical protein [Photorhabdus luminescens]|uniref:Uncharacterized protein n=1 Tax=Photorhabdus luminescens subsp. mexicana TaxID=2100167 RepID=A0A4R4IX91_PHOLU|nr:hypothetical protein [Photorhabdus luminescens]TDB45587.1 hypothetical protein C5468_20355 [Photorhabdus luminescens subsp. mexicana]
MAAAENVLAVYSDRGRRKFTSFVQPKSGKMTLESRMRSKVSCPVWRGGVRKSAIANGNSLALYSTSRTVLREAAGGSSRGLLTRLMGN